MVELSARIDRVPLAYVDVETTGLSPQGGDRVCEVAILRCQGGEVIDAVQQLVNPQRPMGAGAYAVHRISDAMLRDAPTFDAVADDVLDLLAGAVVVGHNTAFDLGFLAAELALLGEPLPPYVALDTLRLARRYVASPSYSLGVLAASLGVEGDGQAHRAMVDVLTTRAVLQRLVEVLWPMGVRTVEQFVAAQGGPISLERRRPVVDVPPPILDALRLRRLLHLRYRSEWGEVTERIVEPLGVTDRGGHVSLVAHCHLRNAQRSFRLDRIIEMDVIESFE
ncbi:MAG TPA: WYL domain-containing protein [Chloroflexi bacterium]|jgi:DNA polymerase-3 subunit epsilon|nr:WYL domain-containing protein [Chloroflexota bacterium]